MPKVRFEPSGKSTEADPEETVAEVAARIGIPIEMVCGGRGKCGRCRVLVRSEKLPISDADQNFLSKNELKQGLRLACQLKAKEDMVVEVGSDLARGEQVILKESGSVTVLDPEIRVIPISVEAASLENPKSQQVRVQEALSGALGGKSAKMSLWMLRSLSDRLRLKGDLSAIVRKDELINLVPAESRKVYGVAVDVGSTTIVAYLIDLETGKEASVQSAMNPQIRYGDDVISRITFTMEKKDGGRILHDLVTACVSDLIAQCCVSSGITLDQIYEVTAVGNTAMHHFLFGLEAKDLTLSPYAPVTVEPLEVKGIEDDIKMSPNGYLVSLPNIAGFVGADHVAVLLAAKLEESDDVRIAIDIGTNTEISVGSSKGIASTSCAAGPAFEGSNLKFGMRGATGAIDHVLIEKDYTPEYTTIGGAPARGICGSGVIDVVAEMFKAGIIDRSGRITEELDSPRIRVNEGQSEYVIATAKESAFGHAITITQNDIVQIQYAKAATFAGAKILMDRLGVKPGEVKEVMLAGAFGNYVHPHSARMIGFFPEVPLDRIIGIGNAAGTGAKMALLDRKAMERAIKLARSSRYIELAAQPEFEDIFFSALYFPHLDTSLFPEVMKSIAKKEKSK